MLEVANTVKFGSFVPQWWYSKLIQIK